jgi:ABC-type molybdenum transport system ATPase subunit/photorepair protein PhrA
MSYQTKVRANYLNRTAKLSFFTHRQKQGDLTRLSEETGYSVSHLSNVTSGTRRVNDTIANAMYNLTSRRMKKAEFAQA